ncbi:MAG: tetratricopeptide repeat protein [Alphaproteobacteria bacterium]
MNATTSAKHPAANEPTDVKALFEKAVDLHQRGQLSEARILYERILRRTTSPQVACNLATILRAQGEVRDAEALYRQALLAKPEFPQAHSGLGNALRDLGRLDDAVAAYNVALKQDPALREAHVNVGNVLQGLGRYAAAADHFARALDLYPDDEETRFTLAAIRGEPRISAPPAYTKNLFDSYADRFDKHLTDDLKYDVPRLMRSAVDKVLGESAAPASQRVVDLGCGTGLCGVAIADLAASLHGTDIAPRMVTKAQERNIYNDIVCEDVVSYLTARPGSFDLALAGDVFIYVGDMEPCLCAAADALTPGGLFAFSVESHAGEGFVLRSTARFAHAPSYVRALCEQTGFTVALSQDIEVRLDRGLPVLGQIYVLRRR